MYNLTWSKLSLPLRFGLYAAVLLTSVLSIVATASAAEFLKGKNVHLTNLHRIDGDVYAGGNDITIDGSIGGDLIATGENITVTGEVSGSAMILSFKLTHTGRTEGSIRMLGDRAVIDGYIGRSILFCGSTLEIRRGAVVRSDVNAYGQSVVLAGTVMGDVTIAATDIDISGQIEGDVDLEVGESIEISPPAVIHGDLTYTCSKELDFSEKSGITVLGEIVRFEPVDPDDEETEETTATAVRFSLLFAAFLFGLILVRLSPTYLSQAFEQLHHRFMKSVGAGLLAAAAAIICLVILALAVALCLVGLLLAANDEVAAGMLLLIFSTLMLPITSFACVSAGLLFYAGKLLPAWLLGYGIIRIFRKTPKLLGKWQLLIGLTILTGFYAAPGGGILFYLAAGIVGSGAIVLSYRETRRRSHLLKPDTTNEPAVVEPPVEPPPD
ncbi:MAG: polymer-forming cytoskeletal protein [candidate division Zixibacteria bacterium]|nr:polymer-forming cytoskeletal protein [candidate division Zixibacteria bacterium]MDH3937907.1 polymer-forming cytoskeletal protein [candidate division Zixibacteria bacterium]MDH4035235.1 polymer-forming cytoskeletal protein [candidate division Zixibacteria bacterium]